MLNFINLPILFQKVILKFIVKFLSKHSFMYNLTKLKKLEKLRICILDH